MKITTGKAPLSLITLISILALSLVVNLPGLAVSPMLERIHEIFPDSSELESQMLTLLPNVLIIPFVLLSGKISMSRHKIAIVVTGLVIFALCSIAYLFAKSMAALIVISCLMGAGAGILVPFSTGLLADTFSGRYQMKEMGLQSGIANLTLVAATFIVGWLNHGDWHLPFLVYLVVLIPLVLTPWLKGIPIDEINQSLSPQEIADQSVVQTQIPQQVETERKNPAPLEASTTKFGKNGFSLCRTAGVFGTYMAMTFLCIIITYYMSFLVDKYNWDSTLTGTATALFFLFIFLPGFFLPVILKSLKDNTGVVCATFIMGGLALLSFVPHQWAILVGCMMCGFGYGVIQPLMYDKATRIVNRPEKATMALSVILSANYIAIVVTPFIIEFARFVLRGGNIADFSFRFNFILSGIFLVVVYICRHKFALSIPPTYYETADKMVKNLNSGKSN